MDTFQYNLPQCVSVPEKINKVFGGHIIVCADEFSIIPN
jgi:hypothetical protein